MANSVTSLIDQLLARMGAGKVGRGAILSMAITVAMIMLSVAYEIKDAEGARETFYALRLTLV